MPDVELVATKDFSYATRRLKAGDRFTVSAPMARVLIGIKKAAAPRVPGSVPAPPPEVIQKAEAAAPPPVEAKPVRALSTASLRALDHDGDGKPGGSRKGSRRRRTAKKG